MLINRDARRKLVILSNLSQYAEKHSFFIKKKKLNKNSSRDLILADVIFWIH